MPIGVVLNAAPESDDVMPWHLCVAFTRTNTWLVQTNEYRDGRQQVESLVENSRKFWELDMRLLMEHLAELRDFYVAHQGPVRPFYFYDVNETPNFSYDLSGNSATGKHVVRFDGAWDQTIAIGQLRAAVAIRLVETA